MSDGELLSTPAVGSDINPDFNGTFDVGLTMLNNESGNADSLIASAVQGADQDTVSYEVGAEEEAVLRPEEVEEAAKRFQSYSVVEDSKAASGDEVSGGVDSDKLILTEESTKDATTTGRDDDTNTKGMSSTSDRPPSPLSEQHINSGADLRKAVSSPVANNDMDWQLLSQIIESQGFDALEFTEGYLAGLPTAKSIYSTMKQMVSVLQTNRLPVKGDTNSARPVLQEGPLTELANQLEIAESRIEELTEVSERRLFALREENERLESQNDSMRSKLALEIETRKQIENKVSELAQDLDERVTRETQERERAEALLRQAKGLPTNKVHQFDRASMSVVSMLLNKEESVMAESENLKARLSDCDREAKDLQNEVTMLRGLKMDTKEDADAAKDYSAGNEMPLSLQQSHYQELRTQLSLSKEVGDRAIRRLRTAENYISQLQASLEGQKNQIDDLRREIGERPPEDVWNATQGRVKDLENQVNVLKKYADRMSEPLVTSHPRGLGKTVTETREMMRRDRDIRTLGLDRIALVTYSDAKNLLVDICRALRVSDVVQILPELDTVLRKLNMFGRLTKFVSGMRTAAEMQGVLPEKTLNEMRTHCMQ